MTTRRAAAGADADALRQAAEWERGCHLPGQGNCWRNKSSDSDDDDDGDGDNNWSRNSGSCERYNGSNNDDQQITPTAFVGSAADAFCSVEFSGPSHFPASIAIANPHPYPFPFPIPFPAATSTATSTSTPPAASSSSASFSGCPHLASPVIAIIVHYFHNGRHRCVIMNTRNIQQALPLTLPIPRPKNEC